MIKPTPYKALLTLVAEDQETSIRQLTATRPSKGQLRKKDVMRIQGCLILVGRILFQQSYAQMERIFHKTHSSLISLEKKAVKKLTANSWIYKVTYTQIRERSLHILAVVKFREAREKLHQITIQKTFISSTQGILERLEEEGIFQEYPGVTKTTLKRIIWLELFNLLPLNTETFKKVTNYRFNTLSTWYQTHARTYEFRKIVPQIKIKCRQAINKI